MVQALPMKREVITYHLELKSRAELRAPEMPPAGLEVRRVMVPCPELNRFFYTAVGGDWFWIDRLGWSYQEWLRYVSRPEIETWIGIVVGAPAGYFELDAQPEGNVEIAYFGLLRQYIGKGFGGSLLHHAAERAWDRGASRVWVHTCSLDHPSALAVYQRRGFKIFKEERAWKELPDRAPGPWPGA